MMDPSSLNASQGTATPADDGALLRRYTEEESEDAFAELVRRHLGLVYSTALRQLASDTHLGTVEKD